MRTRLFLIISTVIFGVALTSTVFYTFILNREFLTSVDRQLRALVLTVIGPDKDLRHTDLSHVDKMITKEIGSARTDKFIIIRDETGNILFKDKTADLVDIDNIPIPKTESFSTEWRGDIYMRVLTLHLPDVDNRVLQVGVLIPREITPYYISAPARIEMFLIIVILGVISSWLLTNYLLRPLRDLGHFLSVASQSVDKKTLLPSVPEELYGGMSHTDEFFSVVSDLNYMIKKINDNYFMHRQWTTQMAHELKTPLSLLGLRMESIFLNKGFADDDKRLIEADMRKISGTINSFLDWAEIEYSENKRTVFACKVQKIVAAAVEARPPEQRARLRMEFASDVTLLCHSQHLEQLVDNLLSNAIKYADPGTPIIVEVADQHFSVIDQGPGIPDEVLSRLGEPFNKGTGAEKTGHGLGLAWVKSICKINQWQLDVSQSADGQTVCKVSFENDLGAQES